MKKSLSILILILQTQLFSVKYLDYWSSNYNMYLSAHFLDKSYILHCDLNYHKVYYYCYYYYSSEKNYWNPLIHLSDKHFQNLSKYPQQAHKLNDLSFTVGFQAHLLLLNTQKTNNNLFFHQSFLVQTFS